ncbi:MAG: ABC transporter permease subunit [Chloroflexaceae bacterium]|jgi:osmoprotectant transport system permease protein|nr:ABC transporter permease subunit [Chloroflexaceae bacterium]
MNYLLANPEIVWELLQRHMYMVGVAVGLGLLIALPLGLLVNRFRWLAVPVLGTLGALYTIPSLALIILLLPIFGLNATSVIVALVIYVQIILVRNVVAGLQAINPAILEAARGMGMNGWQRWWRVQLPLALPIVLAGVRIAAVVAIGIAAIGAKFGAGGLGTLLFDGIAQNRFDKIAAGSLVLAGLALLLSLALLGLERLFDPQARVARAARTQPVACSETPEPTF